MLRPWVTDLLPATCAGALAALQPRDSVWGTGPTPALPGDEPGPAGLSVVYRDGRPCLSMDPAGGPTLRQATPYLPLKERLRLLAEVCHAVDFAHKDGLFHRNLEPANVRIDEDGRAQVAGFGLVRLALDLEARRYRSPEQLKGSGGVGPPSDVFSLGVMLYEVVTGHAPFGGDTALAVSVSIVNLDPPPFSEFRVERPKLEALALRSLDKDPRARPTAHELARALTRASRRTGRATWRKRIVAACSRWT